MDLATLRRRRKLGWIFTLRSGTDTAGMLLRGALLGTALYLMIGNDPFANLKLNGVSYIAAVVWCYYDGALARRKWSTAWLEGLFMHLAGIQMGNILAFVFGNPVWVV